MISFYGGVVPVFLHPNTRNSFLKHKLIVKRKCNRKCNTFGFRYHLTPVGELVVAGYKAGKKATH
jgi:hypothetical protein